MMFAIAGRELRGLLLSPLAWTLWAVVQAWLAWIFVILLDEFRGAQGRLVGLEHGPGVTDLVAAPLFRVAAWCLLVLTPFLTMRLFSEERRNRTLDLLLSAPVSVTAIVLGKYLAVLGFLSVLIALIALMPLSLAAGATLDFGKLAAGVLGLNLLAASFAAVGLYFSTLTAQPVVAAVATLGVLLFLGVIDVAGLGQQGAGGLFQYLSLFRHYDALLLGLFDSADAAYYLLLSLAFLGLAIRRLHDGRLRD